MTRTATPKPKKRRKSFPVVCGIYRLSNRRKNLHYVGQSTSVHARFRQHLDDLLEGTHSNYRLQDEFRAYCQLNSHRTPAEVMKWLYEVEVLEVCDRSELDAREEYWMIRCNAYYNILWPDGGKIQRTPNGDIIPRERKQDESIPWWGWGLIWAGIAIGICLIFG